MGIVAVRSPRPHCQMVSFRQLKGGLWELHFSKCLGFRSRWFLVHTSRSTSMKIQLASLCLRTPEQSKLLSPLLGKGDLLGECLMMVRVHVCLARGHLCGWVLWLLILCDRSLYWSLHLFCLTAVTNHYYLKPKAKSQCPGFHGRELRHGWAERSAWHPWRLKSGSGSLHPHLAVALGKESRFP